MNQSSWCSAWMGRQWCQVLAVHRKITITNLAVHRNKHKNRLRRRHAPQLARVKGLHQPRWLGEGFMTFSDIGSTLHVSQATWNRIRSRSFQFDKILQLNDKSPMICRSDHESNFDLPFCADEENIIHSKHLTEPLSCIDKLRRPMFRDWSSVMSSRIPNFPIYQ